MRAVVVSRGRAFVIGAGLALGAGSALGAAGQAQAAEPFEGKWGPDLKSCREEPIFTLTARTIASPTFGCQQVVYTKNGETWSAKARQCFAEGEDKATAMNFAVQLKDGKMRIDWGKDGQSAWHVRCGR